jgi:Cell Wall Hydrolase
MSQTLTFDLARPWRTHPRETVGLAMLGVTVAVALAGAANSTGRLPASGPTIGAQPASLPVLPDAMAVRPVAPETALEINGRIPFATGPNPAARPFSLRAGTESYARALECLTSAIYYEAGRESTEGQRGVAQVVLNRVRHPAFPASVCGVVYQGSTRQTGCQFTFTCDGSLAWAPEPSYWNRARKVAEAALAGFVQASVGNATHYHANYVAPYWAPTLAKTNVIGAHIFYRWSGGWGRPAAFAQAYSGREADPRLLRTAAMSVPHDVPTPVATETATLAKVDGVQVKLEEDGKRVRVLFTPEARRAAENVSVKPYVERQDASDNLRFALNGSGKGEPERPFGRKTVEGIPQAQ